MKRLYESFAFQKEFDEFVREHFASVDYSHNVLGSRQLKTVATTVVPSGNEIPPQRSSEHALHLLKLQLEIVQCLFWHFTALSHSSEDVIELLCYFLVFHFLPERYHRPLVGACAYLLKQIKISKHKC